MKYYCNDPELNQLYKKHADDAGFDICAASAMEITDQSWHEVKTGLHVNIPKGCVGILKPRSGLSLEFNTDVHAGVIDSGYTGEIIVLLSVLKPPIFIEKGTRIAQLVVLLMPKIEPVRVGSLEELEDTERGADGFGSTGGF